MWRALLVAIAVGACFAPVPHPGSPCNNSPCPSPLECSPITQTCELVGGAMPDARDEDDASNAVAPPNDRASGAVDVTAGGTFTADLTAAHDDVNSCSGVGRDVFYKVTLAAPQVFYFDTFGSDVDTVLAIRPTPCAMPSGPSTCANDQCGTVQSQVALSLPAGESCIVVDERHDASGTAMLHVVPGGRNGTQLASGVDSKTDTTCGATNASQAPAALCQGAPTVGYDKGYFFTACPGAALLLDASTCSASTNFDCSVYVIDVGAGVLACKDDETVATCPAYTNASILTNVPIASSGLYWVIVDSFSTAVCGTYQLATNLR